MKLAWRGLPKAVRHLGRTHSIDQLSKLLSEFPLSEEREAFLHFVAILDFDDNRTAAILDSSASARMALEWTFRVTSRMAKQHVLGFCRVGTCVSLVLAQPSEREARCSA